MLSSLCNFSDLYTLNPALSYILLHLLQKSPHTHLLTSTSHCTGPRSALTTCLAAACLSPSTRQHNHARPLLHRPSPRLSSHIGQSALLGSARPGRPPLLPCATITSPPTTLWVAELHTPCPGPSGGPPDTPSVTADFQLTPSAQHPDSGARSHLHGACTSG